MSYSWKDQVVLITGAAMGIGAALVKRILEEGTKHVAILDLAAKDGLQLQNELNTIYGANKVKFYTCDVTNEEVMVNIFKAVIDEYEHIDIVINNAAIMNDRLDAYKKEIEINVTAAITGTLKAIEYMRADKGGRGGTVINVSSVTALTQNALMPIYFATKSAILQFSNCIGMDEYYSRTKVRVLAVCFGATRTALVTSQKLGSFDPDFEEKMIKAISNCPLQTPEHAACGLVDAFKLGESGSTWLVDVNNPAVNISNDIKEAYKTMYSHVTYSD